MLELDQTGDNQEQEDLADEDAGDDPGDHVEQDLADEDAATGDIDAEVALTGRGAFPGGHRADTSPCSSRWKAGPQRMWPGKSAGPQPPLRPGKPSDGRSTADRELEGSRKHRTLPARHIALVHALDT